LGGFKVEFFENSFSKKKKFFSKEAASFEKKEVTNFQLLFF
jgi:hypothetical protein